MFLICTVKFIKDGCQFTFPQTNHRHVCLFDHTSTSWFVFLNTQMRNLGNIIPIRLIPICICRWVWWHMPLIQLWRGRIKWAAASSWPVWSTKWVQANQGYIERSCLKQTRNCNLIPFCYNYLLVFPTEGTILLKTFSLCAKVRNNSADFLPSLLPRITPNSANLTIHYWKSWPRTIWTLLQAWNLMSSCTSSLLFLKDLLHLVRI